MHRTQDGARIVKVTEHTVIGARKNKFIINYLELLSAFFALKCFAENLRDCDVLLRIDNTTAIAYINKMGGIQC